jgi:hypothetical protein
MFVSLITPGTIAGILSVAGTISIALGKPALGAFFNDPQTAQALTTIATGAVTLAAGALRGVHPQPPAKS